MADTDLSPGLNAVPVYLIDPVARATYNAASPASVLPETWTSPTTAWDTRNYGDVEVQFVGTPGTPYQAQRSLNGTDYVNVSALDSSYATVSTVTAAGTYYYPGRGYLKFSAGAGSTLTRRAAA